MFCGIHMVWEFSCIVHWHLNVCVRLFVAPHLSFLELGPRNNDIWQGDP